MIGPFDRERTASGSQDLRASAFSSAENRSGTRIALGPPGILSRQGRAMTTIYVTIQILEPVEWAGFLSALLPIR